MGMRPPAWLNLPDSTGADYLRRWSSVQPLFEPGFSMRTSSWASSGYGFRWGTNPHSLLATIVNHAHATVNHAGPLPTGTPAEQLLRSDLLRSGWMFAVGGLDAYYCGAILLLVIRLPAWFNTPDFWVTVRTLSAAALADAFGNLVLAKGGKIGCSPAFPASVGAARRSATRLGFCQHAPDVRCAESGDG